jgi:hypothetical protein
MRTHVLRRVFIALPSLLIAFMIDRDLRTAIDIRERLAALEARRSP